MEGSVTRFFPCPICSSRLDVRKSKKGKPYIICDSCGVQMFVRNDSGIRGLNRLISAGDQSDAWTRLAELQQRFQKTCPECGKRFWITPESIATNWLDGKFVGYRCPEPHCKGLVEPKDE